MRVVILRITMAMCLLALAGRTSAQTAIPHFDHVVWVYEENHAFNEIIGSAQAPYINQLASQGALFTNSFALSHPSLPNYLQMFSGSNQGITDDTEPHSFTTPNLGGSLIAKGLTFTGYGEDLPSPGSLATYVGNYDRDHCPWTQWQGAASNGIPATDNLPFTSFPTDFTKLPTVACVTPNLTHIMHDSDGTINQADTWLHDNLDAYVQWARTHNSLLIIRWDEDDGSQNNQVAMIFVGANVKPGNYSEYTDHYSTLRTVEDMFGLPYAGASATATPITDCWTAVTGAPVITTQPASVTVTAGQTAAFSVVASGTAPLTYQWQKNGTAIAGATAASYTTPATTTADSGATFRVVVSNAAGSATSSTATLTVNAAPTKPSITTQPANLSVTAGQTAKFSVVATGTAPLTYQWRKNGTAIAGATAASYTTPATVLADNGAAFTVLVSNSAGSVTSNAATLTVTNASPKITSAPAATPNPAQAGQSVAFAVAANDVDGDALTYAWAFGDGASGAGTAPAHTYSAAGTYTATVTVTDSAGLTAKASVSVVVNAVVVSGPVGYWKLDDGSGSSAVDSSGFNNTGALVGGPAWVTGKIAGGLAFNGTNQYVTVPAAAGSSLDLNKAPVTMAAWINVKTVSVQQAILIRGLSNGIGNGSRGYALWVHSTGHINVGSDGGGNFSSTTAITPNTWHQITAIINGTGSKVYIDGIDRTPASVNIGVVAATNYALTLGAARNNANTGYGRFLNGALDDVRVYNRALSAAEAAALWQMGSGSGGAPVITSSTTAAATVGTAFSYQITATNNPTSYNATGLPAGLSVNTSTGAISGTPSAAGTSSVTLSATNASGTGTATLSLTVSAGKPVITSATWATATVGAAFAYQITATNSPTSFNATGLPAGLAVNTSTGAISGTPSAAGTTSVTLSATNASGTGTAALSLTVSTGSSSGPVTNLHYAAGNNLVNGTYAPGKCGFNLADVSSVDDLNALPDGVMGLVWLGLGDGVTTEFTSAVQPFIGNPKLFGFYLVDEPDPTGQYGQLVAPANLKAESDWIHAHVPGAKTFIVLMNMGTDTNPSFMNTYNSANTDVDLFGLDPYPVKTEFGGADYDVIAATVAAAKAWGIQQSQIVPVYQAFGGGGYSDWILPTASQEQQILAAWAPLVPAPVFDYAYSWGSQVGDSALENTPALQPVFTAHNAPAAAAARSAPLGKAAAALPADIGPMPLLITHLQASVQMVGQHDACVLSGSIPGLPANFNPADQTFTVNVMGVAATFTLDSKGRGKNAQGSMALKTQPGAAPAFSIKLANGHFAETWGLDASKGSAVVTDMWASVEVAGGEYSTPLWLKLQSSTRGAKLAK